MKEPASVYQTLEHQYSQDYQKLQKQSNLLSALRLFFIIAFFVLFYYWLKTSLMAYVWVFSVCIAAFVALVIYYLKIAFKKRIKSHLVEINKKEYDYLTNNKLHFNNGTEYINPKHPYSYDLDIFGEKSLFHHINRTVTYVGGKTLASALCKRLNMEEIQTVQQAVQELKEKLNWRQRFAALAHEVNDSRQTHEDILKWAGEKPLMLSKIVRIACYVLPVLFIVSLVLAIATKDPLFRYMCEMLFVANLVLTSSQVGKIKKQLVNATRIDRIIKNYGLLLAEIENEHFESEQLSEWQQRLKLHDTYASKHFKKLSYLFGQLENIQNLLVSVLLNGLMLYHLHMYKKLTAWKIQLADNIALWVETIGEFESTSSVANFSYNNPSFAYPSLNKNFDIAFEDMGHPLIGATKRVTNSVNFVQHPFIILTGSNMSGKSTFLRSLGVNMVLAGMGAPVCASSAKVHPLDVWVSMRLSDSLSDNESYFFAEIKRLREIIDATNAGSCFVLLDEILRGTNSDDKRTGTVEMIKNMAQADVFGAIATHDLEVCHIVPQFSSKLTNKCFEADIYDNELHFDYRLREGVCKNKNATFLMKKMGIIKS